MGEHAVYPGGPPCQPNCPGPWSSYHDGYADGYENALAVVHPTLEPGDIECPVCKGTGLLHNITAAVEEAQAAGNTILVPIKSIATDDPA